MIKSPSTVSGTPQRDSSAVLKPTTTATLSVAKNTKTVQATTERGSYSEPAQQITSESITSPQEAGRTTPKMTNQPKKTAQPGRTLTNTPGESSGTGKTLTMARVIQLVL